jgi:LPS export ABC transporter protein LptC
LKTTHIYICIALSVVMSACSKQKGHTAPAVNERDSAAMMETYGINMLISDSGVIKYRIVTERSIMNQNINPKRTIFDRGVFMTQFDEKFHVQSYIQCDTAYRYDELRIFELRGHVRINTKNGLKFRGEELFWDQSKHEYYSNKYSYLETPERTLEGKYFCSDENMRKYYVSNSKGSFEMGDVIGNEEDTVTQQSDDTLKMMTRKPEKPRPKR